MDSSHGTQVNNRLRQARIARNWRQRELAEQLGTTVVTVKRWERGYQQPSSYFRAKLSILFGKSAEELGLIDETLSSSGMKADIWTTEQANLSAEEPLALWTVPYLRNSHFTGRDDLLDQIARHLSFQKQDESSEPRRATLSQPQTVRGLGGIGKTQIALEYAYRSREQGYHTHILWFNAASEEAIITSFLTLAARLPNLTDKDKQDQRKLVAAVKAWLEQCQEPWLLIFDNADDLSFVQQYVPQQGQGSILLTTRATAVGWFANSIEVEQMGMLEGTQFLLHRTQRLDAADEEWNEAANVVIALDGLPLALDQAGAYIEETGCSFSDYLQLYEQYRSRLLARRGMQSTNYPDSVATTWSLSFEKVEQAHPAAAILLQLCAYLSPDHIPEELLTDGAAHWPAVLQQAVADQFSFNELLEALLAFSLVKRLAQEHLLSLHRLVQAVQMDQMDSQEQHIWAERVICAVDALFPVDPKDDIESWPRCLRYLEQVQACDLLIQQYHLQLPEAAHLLNRVGIYLREYGSYNLAESLLQRALTIAEQLFGSEHLETASLLNDLGMLYQVQGKREQSESYSRRALHIWEPTLGPEHIRLALPLNNLGMLYMQQGQFEQAELLLQRALHVWEQNLGPDNSQVGGVLNNLGILYAQQGQLERAVPLMQRALGIRERALGPNHPRLVNPVGNLGTLYYELGQYSQAEPLLLRAVRLGEETLGPEHLSITPFLNNLGLLYVERGQYSLAEPLLLRVVHIRERDMGPHHPDLAEPLQVLANLFRGLGQYEQAEALYQRVLSICQQFFEMQQPKMAETLQDLARLRLMQRQPTEALSLSQQALAILEKYYGPHHLKTLKAGEAIFQIEEQMREGPQTTDKE